MDEAFDRAIAQNENDIAAYDRQVAEERQREQENNVVVGQFDSRQSDGSFRFKTPGGGFRSVYGNSAGGFADNQVAQLTQYGPNAGLAETDSPTAQRRENVRAGSLLI